MKKFLMTLALVFALTGTAYAGQNVLQWTDNSSGDGQETRFEIERKSQVVTTPPTSVNCATVTGTYAEVAEVGPNVVTYTDPNLAAGSIYCYRVRAANAAGASAFSNEAGRYIPFTVPGAPSGLIVVP